MIFASAAVPTPSQARPRQFWRAAWGRAAVSGLELEWTQDSAGEPVVGFTQEARCEELLKPPRTRERSDRVAANATNPAASGPAGSHFEGQVGAYYLLSLLTGAEPRGLPATTIDRIELQRAAEGRPLDDVIVHAHDGRGEHAVLEIQVKRTITFAPSDEVFRAVVAQVVAASGRPDFSITRYELAIATARTSRKIDGAYQDVLTWARQLGDAATFVDRINRRGSANDDMRSFVQTFRAHLVDAGAPDDPQTVWGLLRKLQVLVFDFTAPGSTSEQLARERAVRALNPDDAMRAGNLWTTLVELALQVAASGGDRTRARLIEDLHRQSFRLAGQRRYASVRAVIAEDARNALADIRDRVGHVMLTRHDRVAAVHAALDTGRYLEIRGDAGVGKSGILKHFAEQVSTEARVAVLSPGRTIPRGWTAMRAVLGFDGTAYELFSDLASDGGAVLFLDNLDFFQDEERRTVVDLVREIAVVPGLSVIATARRDFASEEPNWLPRDALDRLGRAEPLVIGELSDGEIDELRHAAPELASLLAHSHPARAVTRNLFRLSRLASRGQDEPVPRTEIDMAEQWWRTADGELDHDHRERARVLRALAEQALSRAEPLDVRDQPAGAVNALIGSETLRDLGNDRVTFRHDVLRDWAIATLLHFEPTRIEQLPLDGTASTALARGVELAARMALERAADVVQWQSLVERLSRPRHHGSWRRAALLALVRSEMGSELLPRASDVLLGNRATVLRELIRIVMAVDAEPAAGFFSSIGIDPAMIPASLNAPSGPSWARLIGWLLSLGDRLPAASIPDVVNFYTAWSSGMLGHDLLTPLLLQRLCVWLTEIEAAHDVDTLLDRREPFGGELNYEQIQSLENDLRAGFLLFCNRTPTLAAEYLRSLAQRRRGNDVGRSILRFRGALAQAAPAELADLTATALIQQRGSEERHHRRELRDPFGFIDLDFLPASPAQGPFLELLTHAPQHGLSLIHQLVDHAISFYSGGREPGSDVITISFPDGDRAFPWTRSYVWSRDATGHYSLTSALMALEAWAHRRIDGGETFDNVLPDVLGQPGSPASHLLVAVDLLLSHWPKSRDAAVSFLACPELLCIDRQRSAHDQFRDLDPFGLGALHTEPIGSVTLDALKRRASRGVALDQALGQYAVFGPAELRERLAALLRRAAARLGPPDEDSDLGDPRFMVVHALNLVDPSNWPEVAVTRSDGTVTTARHYQSPETESRHLAALQEEAQPRFADANMQASLGLALEDASRSSPELAAAAVEWAQRVEASPKRDDEDEGHPRMREEAVVIAAMIAMRDGEADLRSRHEAWARSVFSRALQAKDDSVYRFRSGLRFNPVAIALVGMIHLLRYRNAAGDVRTLLEVAGRSDAAAAYGFGAACGLLASIDERLPRAVLRSAFAASVRPSREWRLSEEVVTTRSERQRQRVQAAINAELGWLAGERSEPDWPPFPTKAASPRHPIRLRRERVQDDEPQRPDEYADHQAAAVWVSQLRSLDDATIRPWLREIARAYAAWTAEANGVGLEMHDGLSDSPTEWNDAYYDLLARCLPGISLADVDSFALTSIITLPDEPFFDVTTRFVRSIDAVYFSDAGLDEAVAVHVRSVLANRLMESIGWKRVGGSRSASIEMHIASAIAVLFFNDHSFLQPAKCYLLPKGVDRLAPFLTVLEPLVRTGTSVFVAVVTLNLLEVSPRAGQLSFLVAGAQTWLSSHGDDSEFWIAHASGRRVCGLIEGIWLQGKHLLAVGSALRSNVDRILGALTNLGVPEARRLEEALARG